MGFAPNKGKGKGLAWIRANVAYAGDDCLPWPLGCDSDGYGQVAVGGRIYKAHRYMCWMAHGEPPTGKHYATHSCGNGHLGCMTPRHLSWKTNSENQLERTKHGTRNAWGARGKLTLEQRNQIGALAGKKTHQEIAAQFGLSRSRVGEIINQKTPSRIARGVYRAGGKWKARIRINSVDHRLGPFATEAEAEAAFKAAWDKAHKRAASIID